MSKNPNPNPKPESDEDVEDVEEDEEDDLKPEEGEEERTEGKGEAEEDEDESEKDKTDYKLKFSESTRENQRIFAENAASKEENEALKGKVSKLEADMKEYFETLKDESPDAEKMLRLEKSIKELQTQIFQNKEEMEVGKFLTEHPEAEPIDASLRKLYRTNPNKSVEELWNEFFKPLADKTEEGAKARIRRQRSEMPETGKGSSAKGPDAELSEGEFNELSLEERKKHLKKLGL